MGDRFRTRDQQSLSSFLAQLDIDLGGSSSSDGRITSGNQTSMYPSGPLTGMDLFMRDQETTFTDRSMRLNPTLSSLLGGSSSPSIQLADPDDHVAPPLSDMSFESSDTFSQFSTRETAWSSSLSRTTVSRSAHDPDISLDLGSQPSIATRPDVGDFDEYPRILEREEVCVSCIFKDIEQSPCDERLVEQGFDQWCRHHIQHFDPNGPPEYALCGFCSSEFSCEGNPTACWEEYLEHLWVSHIRNGAKIVDLRPDFRTLRYMLDTDIITQYRYDEICEIATERKPEKHPDLRPADWIPDRLKSKKLLEDEEAYNAENRVVVGLEPVRRREQDRRERGRREQGRREQDRREQDRRERERRERDRRERDRREQDRREEDRGGQDRREHDRRRPSKE